MREESTISAAEALCVIILVLLFGLFPLFSRIWVIGVETVTVCLTLLAWVRGWNVSIPVGVFCSVCILCVAIGVPFSQIWLGVGLIVYVILCRKSKNLRANISWLTVGLVNREVSRPAIVFGVLAAIALILWFLALTPDINDLIEKFLPKWHIVFILIGGLLFSMLNAAVEEGAFRGVILQGLDKSFGPGRLSIAIQAAAFGVFHINGFPRGWLGVLLAGIYGVFMGEVRRRASGMLAPWISHVFIDIVILCIVGVFIISK